MSEDYIFWSLGELSRAIKQRQLSVTEIIQEHHTHIDEFNIKINAVVCRCVERALREAKEADYRIFRGTQRLLEGIPFTIKDSLDTEGLISTAGTTGRTNFIPEDDATVVSRLRANGAILLGKTNTPELTMGGDTDNEIYGRTNNPYELDLSPGGSSGGSAAAVSAGFSSFDLGSDTGGSIREPAHYCGIVGHKPTAGRVPRTGHIIPPGMGAVDSLTQIGPLTRYTSDLFPLLTTIEGPDWIDPSLIPSPMGNPTDVDVKQLRIAAYANNGVVILEPEIEHCVEQVITTLQRERFDITRTRPKHLTDAAKAVSDLRSADGGAMTRRILEMAGTQHAGAHMSQAIKGNGSALNPESYSKMLQAVDTIKSQLLLFLKDYDAIVSPVSFSPARKHGDSLTDTFELWSYCTIHNLTGWPSTVVRVGTSTNGLPMGIQVTARPWRDDVAIALASKIEFLFGGYEKPVLVSSP